MRNARPGKAGVVACEPVSGAQVVLRGEQIYAQLVSVEYASPKCSLAGYCRREGLHGRQLGLAICGARALSP